MLAAIAGALPLHERFALRLLTVPALTDGVLDLSGKGVEPLDPSLHDTATPTLSRRRRQQRRSD